MDCIVDHEGPPATRKYRVRWADGKEHTWEPRANVHPSEVTKYEKAKGIYDDSCVRCRYCNLPCKNDRGRKIHEGRKHKGEKLAEDPDKHALGKVREQEFLHRLADNAVKVVKMKTAQVTRPVVTCKRKKLENLFIFKYLGTLFAADGRQCYDIKKRIALAMSRCGKLKHIFGSPCITLHLKIRLYDAVVCSIFTYGCETWDLTTKTMQMINGANSRMLSHITGRSIHEEARPSTTTLNLVRKIRFRRYRWLGHILRAGCNRLIHKALELQLQMGSPGNMFLDAPPFSDLEDLRTQAADRAG